MDILRVGILRHGAGLCVLRAVTCASSKVPQASCCSTKTLTKEPSQGCKPTHHSSLQFLDGSVHIFSRLHTSAANLSVRQLQQKKTSSSDAGFVLLIIPALCLCLGVWQIKRRNWKLDLIQQMEEKTRAAPVSLPADPEAAADLEYQRVTVEGEFDHTREFFVGPRQLIVPEERRRGFMSSGSTSGVHVITPLRLHTGQEILVNRGWVPHKKVLASSRQQGQVKGIVTLTGVVRKTEQRQPFQPRLEESNNMTFRRDISYLAEKLGTSPIFVDADAGSTVTDGPIGGQTRVSLRNEHFSYIVTWFSLAAATSWMWYRRYAASAKLVLRR